MRTFIAIELPQGVKDAILEAQGQLSSTTAKLSLAHGFHLTLKFLGELTPANVEVVKQCLSKVRFKPFAASVSGVGVFPSEDYVRVVWVGIEPEEGVIKLQQEIDEALEKKFPKDKQFKPHITLARVKLVPDKEPFRQQLQKIKIEDIMFVVDSFKLKRSTLSGNAPVYEDLAVYDGK